MHLFEVTTPGMKEMFAAIARARSADRALLRPVPTNFDPSLAARAPAADGLRGGADDRVALTDPSAAWEEAMMRTLRRVVPGLDDAVLFVDRFGVEFIERWIGKDFGPAVSTAQTPDQVGARRPLVHTPVRGLYLAGCNAGARGVGTELAAASALECVDRILVDLGRPLAARAPVRPRPHAALRPVAWLTRR